MASGADAKAAVADGRVQVNGEIETRKRRQIVAGDVICFAGETMKIKRSANSPFE